MRAPVLTCLTALGLLAPFPAASQTAPASGAPTSAVGAISDDAQKADIERRQAQVRSDIQDVVRRLESGQEALVAYDEFTKAFSAARAAENQARESCITLRRAAEEGGPLEAVNHRLHRQCLENMGVTGSINSIASNLNDKIESDISEIKKVMSQSKMQQDSLNSQFYSLETARKLLNSMTRTINSNRRALRPGS